MADITHFADKTVLIVDHVTELRNQLKTTLASLGFEKLHAVGTIKEAMERISHTPFHIIICDFLLDDTSTDGQQFLEYLRTNDKLPRNSVFMMVSTENAYERVATVAECAPDDYLLKPFTSAQFITRLEHLLDRQATFERVDAAYDKKDWHKVIAECDRLLAKRTKYYVEICKIKASAFQRIEDYDHAIDLYQHILGMRNLPWAKLGLAKAFTSQQKVDEAQLLLNEIMGNHPHYVACYDFASDLMLHQNNAQASLEILKNADKLFSGNLNRSRQLAKLYLTNRDAAHAEALMEKILKRHQHSPIREAADFGLFATALTEQGKFEPAIRAINHASQFYQDPMSTMLLQAAAAKAHWKAGQHDQAQTKLAEALSGHDVNYPVSVLTMLAETCLVLGKQAQGNDIMKAVVQNNPDDLKVQGLVKIACSLSGLSLEFATELIAECDQEVISINNEGVRKAQSGKYDEAVALILSAAERLPNNIHIISNAALVIAVQLAHGTFDETLMQKCLYFRKRVVERNPAHPKLVQIDSLLQNAKATI